jgi:hypothetical protein
MREPVGGNDQRGHPRFGAGPRAVRAKGNAEAASVVCTGSPVERSTKVGIDVAGKAYPDLAREAELMLMLAPTGTKALAGREVPAERLRNDDMAGNVREWMAGAFVQQPHRSCCAPQRDVPSEHFSRKVIKGWLASLRAELLPALPAPRPAK